MGTDTVADPIDRTFVEASKSDTQSKMVYSTHNDSPHSVGCAAAFFPFTSLVRGNSSTTTWFRNSKEQRTIAGCAPVVGCAPVINKIGSVAPDKQAVQSPLLNASEAWTELARRFRGAHLPATRARSEGYVDLKGPGYAARAHRERCKTKSREKRPPKLSL